MLVVIFQRLCVGIIWDEGNLLHRECMFAAFQSLGTLPGLSCSKSRLRMPWRRPGEQNQAVLEDWSTSSLRLTQLIGGAGSPVRLLTRGQAQGHIHLKRLSIGSSTLRFSSVLRERPASGLLPP